MSSATRSMSLDLLLSLLDQRGFGGDVLDSRNKYPFPEWARWAKRARQRNCKRTSNATHRFRARLARRRFCTPKPRISLQNRPPTWHA